MYTASVYKLKKIKRTLNLKLFPGVPENETQIFKTWIQTFYCFAKILSNQTPRQKSEMKREKPLEKLELLRSSLVEGMCQSCMRCEVPLIFFLCLCKPQAGVLGLLSSFR